MDVIQNSWDTTGGAVSLDHVMSQLGRLQMSLQELEGNTFGSFRKTLAVLRKELEQVRSESGRTGPSKRERQIMTRISELLSREEIMEKQRSRINWLRDGNRNTNLFQAKLRERNKRNKIVTLKKEDGTLAQDHEEIEAVTTNFYSDLFSAQDDLDPDAVLTHVHRKVRRV
jgi:hypothetical protein